MNCSVRSILKLFLILLLAVNAQAQETELDVISYNLTIEPNIQEKSIEGKVTISLNTTSGATSIALDAGSLEIDNVSGSSVKSFSKKGKKLVVVLNPQKEAAHELTIDYHGTPRTGLYFDQKKSQAYTVYATNNWMVCHDDPSDKAKIDIKVISEQPDCIANGELIGIEKKGEKQLFHWRQTFSSPTYTYGFVLGDFQQSELQNDQVTIKNYAQGHSPSELDYIFRESPEMISFLEQKSGITYDQTTYSQILIGGYYQEMSGFSVLQAGYGKLVLKDSTETNLISHELAHQWWGNRITCKSWNHFWLNEALATFMSAAYNEHRFGEQKYNSDIQSYFNVYNDLKKRGKDKPLVFKSWTNPTRDDRNIVYFKGAYVLHLLRQEMGELAFWEGIKLYSVKHFDKSVTTIDFQNALEESSKSDLDDFFNKWVY